VTEIVDDNGTPRKHKKISVLFESFITRTRNLAGVTIDKITGNVGIGTTDPSSNTLQVTGSAGKTVGGTTWSDLSDSRLKNIQGEVKGTALDTLMQLRPIKFKWNETRQQLYGGSTDNLMYGFVAQEIMQVIPEFVKQGGDGYFWYNPSGFESILTAAIQEQQEQIASLSWRMEDIQNTISNFQLPISNEFSINSIFNSILTWFEDTYGIVFENGLVKAAKGVFDNLTAGKATVQELCVDDICVTSQDLKALLEKTGVRTFTPTPEPVPEATSSSDAPQDEILVEEPTEETASASEETIEPTPLNVSSEETSGEQPQDEVGVVVAEPSPMPVETEPILE